VITGVTSVCAAASSLPSGPAGETSSAPGTAAPTCLAAPDVDRDESRDAGVQMALQWLAWGSAAMAGQLRPFKVPIALDHSVELVVAGEAIVTAINFASAAAW
jgi:hypothetical protein